MTINGDEQLSALLDGELEGRDAQRAIDRVCSGDTATRAQLGRYRMIGDLMRGESGVLGMGIHEAVRAAIAEEPTVLAPRPARTTWTKPLAGLAVAASVAAAAVVVAPRFLGDPAVFGQGPVIASAPPVADSPTVPLMAVATTPNPAAEAAVPRWQTLDPALGERLNRLVIEHHEFGGRTGVNGPVAHIGLVNYAGR